MHDILYVSKSFVNDKNWKDFKKRFPIAHKVENVKDFDELKSKSFTKFFWVVWDNLIVSEDFHFDYVVPEWDEQYSHVFKNGDYFDGIWLLSKNNVLTKKEFENRFPVDKKEVDIVASFPKVYDRFYISTYEDYLKAIDESKTDMFWSIWNDVEINADFKFDYYIPAYDVFHRNITHVFKNGDHNDGIWLLSKNNVLTKKEFENRFPVDKKEVDIVASVPKPYDKFVIDTYEDYLKAIDESKTDMFWSIWNDVEINADFKFDYYIPAYDVFHRNITHVFKNGDHNDGIWLLSKNNVLTKKEFENRFPVDKKEVDIVASVPIPFERFFLNSYEDYLKAISESKTDMFWSIWNDVEIKSDFKFDYYVPAYDVFHRNITHVFKNGDHNDGICLFSKKTKIYKREFNYRYFLEKKEVDIVASVPKPYDKFVIDTYEDYLDAREKSSTDLFWLIPTEVSLEEDFDLDSFSHHNRIEKNTNHVFQHIFRGDKTYTGICLTSKSKILSKKEIFHRYLVEKKEYPIVASRVKPYEIVFISYNEPNADMNFENLKKRFSRIKRIHGVKGIHQAHIEAAKLVDTIMFWVVDGDAEVLDDFNFDYEVGSYDRDIVHVWRSQNPVNKLIYGYGGVKLLPTNMTLNMDTSKPDMTTSISNKFKALKVTSNRTVFNTDPFNTWKSAFRECVKLSSKIIDRQKDAETLNRLDVWCTIGEDQPFGEYSIQGAREGKKFGEANRSNLEELKKINDFDWLKSKYDSIYG